jgi:hypothetical protein
MPPHDKSCPPAMRLRSSARWCIREGASGTRIPPRPPSAVRHGRRTGRGSRVSGSTERPLLRRLPRTFPPPPLPSHLLPRIHCPPERAMRAREREQEKEGRRRGERGGELLTSEEPSPPQKACAGTGPKEGKERTHTHGSLFVSFGRMTGSGAWPRRRGEKRGVSWGGWIAPPFAAPGRPSIRGLLRPRHAGPLCRPRSTTDWDGPTRTPIRRGRPAFARSVARATEPQHPTAGGPSECARPPRPSAALPPLKAL